MPRYFLLFVMCLPFYSLVSQDLSFYKEIITMRISNHRFYITGTYYLKNSALEQKVLIYPFPVGPAYGKVDSVVIFDLTDNQLVKPEITDSAKLLFIIDFTNDYEKVLQISYQQELKEFRAEYILESTLNWREPIKEVHYQLIISKDLEITDFSILPGDSIITENEIIYTWEKYNYLPSRNMIFDFRYK